MKRGKGKTKTLSFFGTKNNTPIKFCKITYILHFRV